MRESKFDTASPLKQSLGKVELLIRYNKKVCPQLYMLYEKSPSNKIWEFFILGIKVKLVIVDER